MWKFGLVGFWCVGVCLTAVYLASRYQSPTIPAEPAFPILTEHHSVASDEVTVPIIRNGKLDGYLLAQVSVTANDEAYHHRFYPVSVDLTDQLMVLLQRNIPLLTDPDFTVDRLRGDLVKQMNERLGGQVFYNTLITRLDYLTPADLERMRDSARNRMKVTPLVDKALLDTVPGWLTRGIDIAPLSSAATSRILSPALKRPASRNPISSLRSPASSIPLSLLLRV